MKIDHRWKAFLEYIYKGGGWRGPQMPWNPNTSSAPPPSSILPKDWPTDDMNELEKLTRDIVLSDTGQDEVAARSADLPWREGN